MRAVLLDTCALIWLGFNSEELTPKMREAIETASVLYVSPVSLWEIALKHKKGKLTLKTSPREWYSRVQREYGIMFLPLTPGSAFRSVELPDIHNDPADRFIIATALENDLPVVTSDDKFEKYGVKTIR